MKFRLSQVLAIGCVAVFLCGCVFQRAQTAADAKKQMVGMTKEQVLACMGSPRQKAQADATEVWSYHSTDGLSTGYSDKYKSGNNTASYGLSSRYFCDVNVVMKDGRVAAIHYNGPTGGLLDGDEQCGYAVEHCVAED